MRSQDADEPKLIANIEHDTGTAFQNLLRE